MGAMGENDETDARFEALARRTREAEARETSEDDDLLRPLDPAEKSALADRVFASLDAPRAEVVPITHARKAPRRKPSFVLALVAAALVAAAAAFFLARKPAPQPMAAYTLTVSGGNQATRGDPPSKDAVIRLDPASRLSLELRPEAPVPGALAIRSFLVRDGKAREWEAPASVGKGGVVSIEGSAAALFEGVPEGSFDLVLMVGHAEALPDEEALTRAAVQEQTRLSGVSIHRVRVALSRPKGALPGGGQVGEEKRTVFAGCASVRRGGECELSPSRALTFFIPSIPTEALSSIVVDVDGATVEPSSTNASRGGATVRVKVPEGAKAIRVSSDSGSKTLALLEPSPSPNEMDAGRAALRQKARAEMAEGRKDQASALFREAIAADRAAGRVSDELDDSFALSYGLIFDKRDFGEARALLSGLGEALDACPEARPKAAYYEGLLALEVGDLRGTLAAFAAASEGAARLGLDAYRSAVLEQEAEVLAVLGRHAEARARIGEARALVGESAGACRRAQVRSNEGWIALREGRDLGEARSALESALAVCREGCAAGLGNVAVNLALVAIEMGRAKEARKYLDEARGAGGMAKLDGWQRLAEARLSFIEKNPKEALAASEVLRDEGEKTLSAELVFEGALGRAEALASLGRVKEAREAYAETQAALAAWGARVPLGEGRSTFFATRARGARQTLGFLLKEAERGDESAAREALDIARGSLSGFLDSFSGKNDISRLSPEARRRWEEAVSGYRRERAALEERMALRRPGLAGLEAEHVALRGALDRALAELSAGHPEAKKIAHAAPLPGEAYFVVHAAASGYVGIVLSEEGRRIAVRGVAALPSSAPPAALAAAFLEPFHDVLSNVRTLKILVPGELSTVDWQALPFEGSPLFERMDVVYSLDLPEAPRSPLPRGATALLITDPTEDLPGARGSADAVAAALEGRGMRVLRLSGAAATHEAVRDALERETVELVHYAGHATFEGPDGLEASLRLAHRERFSVADVMALSRVPAVVVLVGCDTARAGSRGSAEAGLGLGQVFLLKGARVSIAAPRPMEDGLAEQATRLLYAEPIERDPVAALRAATRALRLARPTEDWAVLRALGA